MNRKTFAAHLGLAALVVAASGCASTKLPQAHETFLQNPAAYRRIEIMPVVCAEMATFGKSLTLSELKAKDAIITGDLGPMLKRELAARGYTSTQPVVVLSQYKEWCPLDRQTQEVAWEVQNEFTRMAENIMKNLPQESGKPFRQKFGTRLTELQGQLHMEFASAIVLVQTMIFLVSDDADVSKENAKRLATDRGEYYYQYMPNRIVHRITLVDAHTREVLWFNQCDFPEKDARKYEELTLSVNRALSKLPTLPPRKDPEPSLPPDAVATPPLSLANHPSTGSTTTNANGRMQIQIPTTTPPDKKP